MTPICGTTLQLDFNASSGLTAEAAKLVDAQIAALEEEELAMLSSGEEGDVERSLETADFTSFARAYVQSKPKSKAD